MSHFLERLAMRARGAASSVSPRRPSRYESTAGVRQVEWGAGPETPVPRPGNEEIVRAKSLREPSERGDAASGKEGSRSPGETLRPDTRKSSPGSLESLAETGPELGLEPDSGPPGAVPRSPSSFPEAIKQPTELFQSMEPPASRPPRAPDSKALFPRIEDLEEGASAALELPGRSSFGGAEKIHRSLRPVPEAEDARLTSQAPERPARFRRNGSSPQAPEGLGASLEIDAQPLFSRRGTESAPSSNPSDVFGGPSRPVGEIERTVTVTIGSIEVRAMKPQTQMHPQAGRKQESRGSKPGPTSTLDDYLKRRREGGR